MSRLDFITIGIVVVCLAALGYLVYKIVSLMNPPEEAITTSIDDAYTTDNPDDLTYTDVGDEDTDWDDDEAGSAISDEDPMGTDAGGSTDSQYAATDSDTGSTGGDSDNASTSSSNGGGSDSGSSSAISSSGSSSSTSSSSGAATSSYDSSGGRYMVAAGSFRVRANADRLVRKLKGMGYSNARVSLFDRGSYAVVVVDRFDSHSRAKQMVTDLTNAGVDAIVREKN